MLVFSHRFIASLFAGGWDILTFAQPSDLDAQLPWASSLFFFALPATRPSSLRRPPRLHRVPDFLTSWAVRSREFRVRCHPSPNLTFAGGSSVFPSFGNRILQQGVFRIRNRLLWQCFSTLRSCWLMGWAWSNTSRLGIRLPVEHWVCTSLMVCWWLWGHLPRVRSWVPMVPHHWGPCFVFDVYCPPFVPSWPTVYKF